MNFVEQSSRLKNGLVKLVEFLCSTAYTDYSVEYIFLMKEVIVYRVIVKDYKATKPADPILITVTPSGYEITEVYDKALVGANKRSLINSLKNKSFVFFSGHNFENFEELMKTVR